MTVRYMQLLLCSVVVIVISACGVSSLRKATSTPWRYPGEQPTAAATDEQLLAWDEENLIGSCISVAGYNYYPGDWHTLNSLVRVDRDNWQPDHDMAWAKEHGYGLDDETLIKQRAADDRERQNQPEQRYFDRLSSSDRSAYDTLMHGNQSDVITVNTAVGGRTTPRGGCISKARERLYGSLQRYADFELGLADMGNEVSMRMSADPSMQASLQRWSVCMTPQGYQVTKPEDAYASAQSNYQRELSDAHVREVAIATADANCRESSGLNALIAKLHGVYWKAVAAAHKPQLDAYPMFIKEASVRARADLAQVAAQTAHP